MMAITLNTITKETKETQEKTMNAEGPTEGMKWMETESPHEGTGTMDMEGT
jgi:hypothetical protein